MFGAVDVNLVLSNLFNLVVCCVGLLGASVQQVEQETID